MAPSDTAQRLLLIEEALTRIELAQTPSALALVAERLSAIDTRLKERVPIAEIRAAIEDVIDTRLQMGSMREVYTNQRDALVAHFRLIDDAMEAGRVQDQELRELLIQLREIGRKHVHGLADLERAARWHETEAERRDAGWVAGDAERRKAG